MLQDQIGATHELVAGVGHSEAGENAAGVGFAAERTGKSVSQRCGDAIQSDGGLPAEAIVSVADARG